MRLDLFLKNKFSSRTKAAEAIEKGLVLKNGKVAKPSDDYKDGDNIEFITPEEQFVSNGGYKLSKAIKDFNGIVKDMTFIDVGASNGGFTHCLLQNGAKRVYAIDVGESQLEKIVAEDNRVVVMDNTNARYLTQDMFQDRIEGAVIDVSFISLKLVLPAVKEVLQDNGVIYALIKPQFECGKKYLSKTGIVTEFSVHKMVVEQIYDFCININLQPIDITNAPIKEKKNIEYVILLKKGETQPILKDKLLAKMNNLRK